MWFLLCRSGANCAFWNQWDGRCCLAWLYALHLGVSCWQKIVPSALKGSDQSLACVNPLSHRNLKIIGAGQSDAVSGSSQRWHSQAVARSYPPRWASKPESTEGTEWCLVRSGMKGEGKKLWGLDPRRSAWVGGVTAAERGCRLPQVGSGHEVSPADGSRRHCGPSLGRVVQAIG